MFNSHIVLGAGSIYRLTRRVHQLHLLDIEYVLLAVEGESARSERPEEDAHQLLSMGAVHAAHTGAHVLLAVGDMALVQHEDGLRHRHARQVCQQHGASESGGAREDAALLGQAHGQGARGAARDQLGSVRARHQLLRQVLLHHIRQAAGQLPTHRLLVHQAPLHIQRDRSALPAEQIPWQ